MPRFSPHGRTTLRPRGPYRSIARGRIAHDLRPAEGGSTRPTRGDHSRADQGPALPVPLLVILQSLDEVRSREESRAATAPRFLNEPAGLRRSIKQRGPRGWALSGPTHGHRPNSAHAWSALGH